MFHVHYLLKSLLYSPSPAAWSGSFQWESDGVIPLFKSGLPTSLKVKIKVLIITETHCMNQSPVDSLSLSPLLSSCCTYTSQVRSHIRAFAFAQLCLGFFPPRCHLDCPYISFKSLLKCHFIIEVSLKQQMYKRINTKLSLIPFPDFIFLPSTYHHPPTVYWLAYQSMAFLLPLKHRIREGKNCFIFIVTLLYP